MGFRIHSFGICLSVCLAGLCALGSLPVWAVTETVDITIADVTSEAHPEEKPPKSEAKLDLILPQAETEESVAAQLQVSTCLGVLENFGATEQIKGPVLTLDEALELALSANPQLVALALEVDASFAQVLQARQKPSPELDVSLSEFLGMNQRRAFRHSVSEVTYSKVQESLDKRLARQKVARLGGELARWDYEAALRDIQHAVARAYVAVLVAQENVRVQRQLLSLTEALRNAVSLRYAAGTVSQLELSRLDIEVANIRIGTAQAESELDAARKVLSSQWGDLTPDFAAVAGSIDDTLIPPATEELVALLPDNPFLARFATDSLARQARLDLALREARPDYTVRGGVQGFGDSGEMALTFGVTIPMQGENRNQGAIREAKVRIEQIEAQREATHLQLQAQLVDAVERLRAAYLRANALCTEVIPAARDNLDRTVVGYRYGKFNYLDVLESERTLIEAVDSFVQALAEYQTARVDVERLIGKPLASVAQRAVLELQATGQVETAAEVSVETATPSETETQIILEDGSG